MAGLITNPPIKGERATFLHIMEIQTQTCYAGTQVFYLARHIIFRFEPVSFSPQRKYKLSVYHSLNNDSQHAMGWHRYREDELMEVGSMYRKFNDAAESGTIVDEHADKIEESETK